MSDARKKIIARPYAKAAFEVAHAANELSDWHVFLVNAAALVTQPQVLNWIADPRVSPEQLESNMLELCADWLNASRGNFLRVLIDNKRLIELPEMAELYAQYRYQEEKTIAVRVASYTPLAPAQRDALLEKLEKRFARKVTLDCVIDETLLGGAMIVADDFVIDGSVRDKLVRLRRSIELE